MCGRSPLDNENYGERSGGAHPKLVMLCSEMPLADHRLLPPKPRNALSVLLNIDTPVPRLTRAAHALALQVLFDHFKETVNKLGLCLRVRRVRNELEQHQQGRRRFHLGFDGFGIILTNLLTNSRTITFPS